MKHAVLVLTALVLTLGPAGAQEKTFRMGSQPTSNGLTQTVRHTPTGTVIHYEQAPSLAPSAPTSQIYGLSAVDLTPDRRNLMSAPYLVPQQAFIGMHPYGQPVPGGSTTPLIWNQQYGPLMPFYGNGLGIVLGDDRPHLYGW